MTESSTDDIVSITRLIKCGFPHVDNSALMLLRLLDQLSVSAIAIAGMDGFTLNKLEPNYANSQIEMINTYENPLEMNREITDMLRDYMQTRISHAPVSFITPSRYSSALKGKDSCAESNFW